MRRRNGRLLLECRLPQPKKNPKSTPVVQRVALCRRLVLRVPSHVPKLVGEHEDRVCELGGVESPLAQGSADERRKGDQLRPCHHREAVVGGLPGLHSLLVLDRRFAHDHGRRAGELGRLRLKRRLTAPRIGRAGNRQGHREHCGGRAPSPPDARTSFQSLRNSRERLSQDISLDRGIKVMSG